MRNKAYNLAKYVFQKGEPLLLDANVWLYLYPAPSSGFQSNAISYSNSLKSMLTAETHLVMDALILSEYLNRYCRIEWNALHKQVIPDFKVFRKSRAFQSVGAGAATYARAMIKLCACHDHPFSAVNIAQILADFETGVNDFNDGLLAETCRNHGWKLVTNDSDFKTGGIEVLTFHSGLLKSCP